MKFLFTITYRKENEYGQYWGDKKTIVKVYASNINEAKDKIDEIDPCGFKIHNQILHWEAEEIESRK